MQPAQQTIAGLLSVASRQNTESETARLDAEVLLGHVLDKPRSYLYTWPEKILPSSQVDEFLLLWSRRLRGEPVAHITGLREFWSMQLMVTPDTLIPRPDTEVLVEQALRLGGNLVEQLACDSLRVLDLGTGTGAVALAVASEQPDWLVTATDKFTEVLRVSEINREALGIANLSFQQSDWFENLRGDFHLIVSNPPYIDSTEPELEKGDVCFEPRSALVAACGGLADIRQIIQEATGYLVTGGYLVLEHGYGQAKEVGRMFREKGYTDVTTVKDLAGKDRVTFGRFSGSI